MTAQDHHDMTADEREELRQFLKAEVADWIERRPDFIADWDAVLDEDSRQFYVTEAEIAVFHLDEDWLPALFVAYAAYEVLIDIVEPLYDTQRAGELIKKARSICPPAEFFEFSVPYRHRRTDRQWFQWFAKEFLDIPLRQSRAFYDKVDYNLAAITSFADEE